LIFLFIHQNFPGQYLNLVRYLGSQAENEVYFISQENDNYIGGVKKITYEVDTPKSLNCHPFTAEIDPAIRIGLRVAEVCRDLKQRGITPNIIVGHNGWGETLFVKDIYPDVPLLAYFEFFYHVNGIDVGFDPESPALPDDAQRLRVRNTVNYLGFGAADWGHTATSWQRSLYPADMRRNITAIHEGVNTDRAQPDNAAWIKLAREEIVLSRNDEVITFVARNLEPYRGFHIFMRTLPELLKRRPNAHVVIVGGDGVSYGRPPPPGMTFRELYLGEVGHQLELSRVHFLGQLDHTAYLNVLQVSSVHVYMTYPFVLSWSFIEALSCGCLVLASDTPPVREVLRHEQNGLLFDFFSPTEMCDRIDAVFAHPDRMQSLRTAARETAVSQYCIRSVLPRWLNLLHGVMTRNLASR
jgi:glycosyltransferase involved in cell wall biosynthesis